MVKHPRFMDLRFAREIDYADCYTQLCNLAFDGQLPIEILEHEKEVIVRGDYPTKIDRFFFQLFGIEFKEEWDNIARCDVAYAIADAFLKGNDVGWLWSTHAPSLIRVKMSQMGIS